MKLITKDNFGTGMHTLAIMFFVGIFLWFTFCVFLVPIMSIFILGLVIFVGISFICSLGLIVNSYLKEERRKEK